MSFPVLILRVSDKIVLASYECNINTYFISLIYLPGKQTVWSEYNYPESTTVAKTRLVSAFLVSIVVRICSDIEFFLLGLSALVMWLLT